MRAYDLGFRVKGLGVAPREEELGQPVQRVFAEAAVQVSRRERADASTQPRTVSGYVLPRHEQRAAAKHTASIRARKGVVRKKSPDSLMCGYL